MSHDKVVNYIDVDLKDVLPEEQREELLALHYAAIQNARTVGLREGIREQQQFGDDLPVPPKPEFPPNVDIKESELDGNHAPFAAALVIVVLIGCAWAGAAMYLATKGC